MIDNLSEVDKWWSSLTRVEQSRIATKIETKNNGCYTVVGYPACTTIWMMLSEARKQNIKKQVTDKHGVLLPEYREGETMSY